MDPLPRALAAALVTLTVAGKAGDVLGVALVSGKWALALLALNANDLHCGLTAATVPPLPWFCVALARRLAEDPLFFYIGWTYRDQALALARSSTLWWGGGGGSISGSGGGSDDPAEPPAAAAAEADDAAADRTIARFRRAAHWAVVVEPGALVCVLAGASRMPPATFALLNVAGTAARLAAIRVLGVAFRAPLAVGLGWIATHRLPLLVIACAATAAGSAGLTAGLKRAWAVDGAASSADSSGVRRSDHDRKAAWQAPAAASAAAPTLSQQHRHQLEHQHFE